MRACLLVLTISLVLINASAYELPKDKARRQSASWGYRRAHKRGDLPVMPEYRAPNGTEWTNSVAICAITKDENTTDV